ncbi:hypothetical protein K438DRAFT_1774116 [Mycena galopus ATCC 62051]|nr:hypothetical protein K438DRAFT_1774116 [Mycena galopus ATCC 62051]
MNIGLTYGKEQKLPTRMDNNQHTDSDVATELLVDDGDTCLATCTTTVRLATTGLEGYEWAMEQRGSSWVEVLNYVVHLTSFLQLNKGIALLTSNRAETSLQA